MQSQENAISKPVKPNVPKQQSSSRSTNKIILDYLLYLSIQSRLKQARVELLELSTPFPDTDHPESIEARKKRWIETANKAEQDKNAVEAIVAGILSAGAKAPSSFQTDSEFEQRLHLCQLTTFVFGRFDATLSGQHAVAHNSARRRRHEAQMITATTAEDGQEDATSRIFSRPILPPFCRRHRLQDCHGCRSPQTTTTPATRTDHNNSKDIAWPAGLTEAIPTFLKTSADMLRRTLENSQHEEGDVKPMIFAGQRVMGGGMPPRWYDLFLELLTQAAIESYLCDGQSGLKPIFEIFSYGDVEDEDEPENETEEEDENDEEEYEDEWGVRAADHHLLFPKTRTMYLFKTQVREREKEFLKVDEKDDLKQHFVKLAQRYPLESFEKNMGEFIQMILSTMEVPVLDKYENGDASPLKGTSPVTAGPDAAAADQAPALSLPPVYKYPGDGSLLMPEIPDDDQPSIIQPAEEEEEHPSSGHKRRASESVTENVPDPKKQR